MNSAGLKYTSGSWQGYIAADWQNTIPELEPWLAAHPGQLVVSYPSREVRRIETPRGVLYAKIIRGLTDPGLTGRDPGSFLKWYCRPSRALATWRISWQILAAGFRCARPVLAVRRRSGCGYPTDIFISEDVQAQALSDRLPQTPAAAADLAAILGRELAAFHRAGFGHGDCILRNLCLDSESRLIFLDNDRSKRLSRFWPFRACRRNLAQLGYSARRLGLPEAFVQKMFSAYAQAAAWPAARTAAETAALLSAISRRLQQRERNLRRKLHRAAPNE
ncbi:MAG: hypothetical protein GX564_02415 [Oligosphaeraceae bacterium]|nr:hypothetical protein [Oligosphaeraceae bacterium]